MLLRLPPTSRASSAPDSVPHKSPLGLTPCTAPLSGESLFSNSHTSVGGLHRTITHHKGLHAPAYSGRSCPGHVSGLHSQHLLQPGMQLRLPETSSFRWCSILCGPPGPTSLSSGDQQLPSNQPGQGHRSWSVCCGDFPWVFWVLSLSLSSKLSPV